MPDMPATQYDDEPRKLQVPRVRIDAWDSGIQQKWTPRKLHSAIYDLKNGDLGQATLLVDAMLNDDEIPTSCSTALGLISGAEVRFGSDDDGEPDELAEELEHAWPYVVPTTALERMLFWFDWIGVAVGTLDWKRVDGKWKPCLRALSPEFLWWDSDTVDESTGLHGVWRYDSRDGTSQIVTPGDGRWVLFEAGSESYRHCSAQALALTWLIKQYTLRDWARYNERHGLPMIKAFVPMVASGADKQQFHADVKNVGTDSTVTLPRIMSDNGQEMGYDIELLEANDQAWETFKQTVDRCDRKFKMHFLGTNTGELEGTAGSRATQESGRSIAMQKAQEKVRRIIPAICEQIIRPLMELGLGKDYDDETPKPRFLIEGDEDLLKRAQTMDAFFAGLVKAKTAGYVVANIEQEAAQYGLELEEKEVEPMPMGPNGQPMPPGPNGAQPKPGEGKEEGDTEGGEELSECGHNHEALSMLETVGNREQFEAAQDYVDGLSDHGADLASKLERIEAERMVSILENAKSPAELAEALRIEVEDATPVELAAIFEKAMILATLGGYFAVESEL